MAIEERVAKLETAQEFVVKTLVRIEGKLDKALEDGAAREGRLQVMESTCSGCDKAKAALRGSFWVFLGSSILLIGSKGWDLAIGLIHKGVGR